MQVGVVQVLEFSTSVISESRSSANSPVSEIEPQLEKHAVVNTNVLFLTKSIFMINSPVSPSLWLDSPHVFFKA